MAVGGFKLSIALLLWPAVPASAAWQEARSPHFIVYSEGSPDSIRKFAASLERFDKGLRKLLRYDDPEEAHANPVTVFVVDNVKAVSELCKGGMGPDNKGCASIAGFYSGGRASGAVAFVPRGAGAGSFDDRARAILFHEYAHHLMKSASHAVYPAWYVEGFAEFVSSVKLDRDDSIGIGLPDQGAVYTLMTQSPMPFETVLPGSPWKMSKVEMQKFYASSWLLTHFLTFTDNRSDQLSKYLNAINIGVPAAEAAANAFGDLVQLDKEAAAYLKRTRIAYFRVPVAKVLPAAIKLRTLSAGEAAMMPIRIQSQRGVNSASAAVVVADARRIAAAFPDDPGAQDALAEAEFDADHLEAAEAAVDRSLNAAPDGQKAMIYKAQIIMRRAAAGGADDPQTWRTARSWLLKANKIDANSAWPLLLFYQSYMMQGIKPTTNAVQALQRSLQLAPQDNNARMLVVRQFIIDDDYPVARTVLAPLAFDPHLSGNNMAVRLIGLLDKNDKAGIRAMFSMPWSVQAD